MRTTREAETGAENPQWGAEGIGTGQGQKSRTKAGKTAQGGRPARLGLVPCAPSFAIETANAYRISGRNTNTPALGIRRRGTGAHREPEP